MKTNIKTEAFNILLGILSGLFEIAITIAKFSIKAIVVFILIFVAVISDSQDSI